MRELAIDFHVVTKLQPVHTVNNNGPTGTSSGSIGSFLHKSAATTAQDSDPCGWERACDIGSEGRAPVVK